MIFSELYSAYYNAVADILGSVIRGGATREELKEKIGHHAFAESCLTVLPALRTGKWRLLRPDLTTPLRHEPTMPLTLLQRRWIKGVSLDLRYGLFSDRSCDDPVEPLFTDRDYRVIDRRSDGDPFGDPGYIRRFRCIADAVRAHRPLTVLYASRNGRKLRLRVLPERLEYSDKDGMFRLVASDTKSRLLRLSSILDCEPCDSAPRNTPIKRNESLEVTFTVTDRRNALERALLHFSHFEKRVVHRDGDTYIVTLVYDRSDETELVIRILSFGPFIRVIEPAHFVGLIRDRLRRQRGLICTRTEENGEP